MIIKELIEILKTYPEDLQVVVDGYEAHFSEPFITTSSYDFDKGNDGVYGRYQVKGYEHDDNGLIKCLVIGR